MRKLLLTFLAGFLVILPLFLTIAIIGWLVSFLNRFIGPESMLGQYLISLGLGFNAVVSYLIGLGLVMGAIFLLGMVVQSRIGSWFWRNLIKMVRKIPLVSNIYDLSAKAVGMISINDDQPSITDMKAVWCNFGGQPGAKVLALLPTSTPIKKNGEDYLGVLVPSAPVPFGGALIYVPSRWIEPAGDVEDLVSTYVSMGMTVMPDENGKALIAEDAEKTD